MRAIPGQVVTALSLASWISTIASQSTNSTKRGIAYLPTQYSSDYNIFLSRQSPITWYYNWSPYQVGRPSGFNDIEFVPLLHNLDSLPNDLEQISNLPERSKHLLTFNEPDGSTDGGGTNLSPADAAKAYHDRIAPLSVSNGGKWRISHPATTGTLSGLNWLQRFNSSCYTINNTHGCHMDFIATHFYGDFPAMANWLGTLNEWYNTNTSSKYSIWITELSLPQQSAQTTEVMMNSSLPYLDALSYVERYSWFGIFRLRNANGYTGDGVALLDNNGALTELGALYLGPRFSAGLSAESGNTDRADGKARPNLGMTLGVVLFSLLLVRFS